jgi:pimeloyl-ACP methyl ester carboxylesterase
VWRATFVNDARPELAHAAYQNISPQGYDILLERVELVDLATLQVPVSYVLPTEDIVYPPGEWGWHPRLTSRLGPHRFLQIPGGHEVMFTDPEGVAQAIVEAACD